MTFELQPLHQKSYYGKARVLEDKQIILLQSYSTVVAVIAPEKRMIYRTWNGYSATTQKHINDFLRHYGFTIGGKHDWFLLPYTPSNEVYAIEKINTISKLAYSIWEERKEH